jgi:hypothetical protein
MDLIEGARTHLFKWPVALRFLRDPAWAEDYALKGNEFPKAARRIAKKFLGDHFGTKPSTLPGYKEALTAIASNDLGAFQQVCVSPLTGDGCYLAGKHLGYWGEQEETDVAMNLQEAIDLFRALDETVTVVPRLKSPLKKKLNNALSRIVPGQPMRGIPLSAIAKAFLKLGVVLVQEDGTEWSGIITGSDGEAKIDLAPVESGAGDPPMYQPYSNTWLVLTWHRFGTGRYEVVAYVS